MAILIGVSGSIELEQDKVFLMRNYFEALEAVDLTPVLLSLDMPPKDMEDVLSRLDGLMLAGGWDIDPKHYGQQPIPEMGEITPLRDAFELPLIRAAIKLRLPTLGICRGIQSMNVALGGTLYQDLPAQKPDSEPHQTQGEQKILHEITLLESTPDRLFPHTGHMTVNSFHHQAIDQVADGLVAFAHAKDGVIEGIYHPEQPYFVGVQWHPERMYQDDAIQKALFIRFADACRTFADQKQEMLRSQS